jgi:hypothetical protein
MKIKDNKGSALLLVIIGVLVLSILGITGLRKTTTELNISRNFFTDKSAFFIADSGIHFGINALRIPVDPTTVSFSQSEGNGTFKSGPMDAASAEYVTAYTAIPTPYPPGMSIEEGGEAGIAYTAWSLVVSSQIISGSQTKAQKEIQVAIMSLSSY